MRKIALLLPALLLSAFPLSAATLPGEGNLENLENLDRIWKPGLDDRSELVEAIPEYQSTINWSTGKVRTEVDLPASRVIPNIGKYMNNYSTEVREELRQNLIKAMGYVRVSDLFLLKDYYSMKNELRYEIIAFSDRAFYYPPIETKGRFRGIVELGLFGKSGLANLFYRDIDKAPLTNYIQSETGGMEYFDSIVIDTVVHDGFQPSIAMRIWDQDGVLLYGPETVDREALEEKGICEYTTSLTSALSSKRAGTKMFYIVPYALKGRMQTDFVLHNRDAARLFANPQTLKQIRQARVIVVVPSRDKTGKKDAAQH